MIMLIAANSSSAWNSAPPTLARPGASHSRMSEAGVIGYAAAKRMPPRIAPSPVISLPEASHRRALRGFGVAKFRPRSRRVAASMPARRPAIGNGLGHFLDRHFGHTGGSARHDCRQVAAARIADDETLRTDIDFRSETIGV